MFIFFVLSKGIFLQVFDENFCWDPVLSRINKVKIKNLYIHGMDSVTESSTVSLQYIMF